MFFEILYIDVTRVKQKERYYMNIIDDYDYVEIKTDDSSYGDTCETVNKWLDDFGWV